MMIISWNLVIAFSQFDETMIKLEQFFIIEKCPPTFVFVTSNVLIPVLFVRHPFLYRYSGVGNNK